MANVTTPVRRLAILDRDACTRDKTGYVCVKVCPVNRARDKCITIDEESKYPLISNERCIGCGICVKKCPNGAIYIINLSKDLGEPIFSYGPNMFRLYGLPIPKKGSVIGLIGKNGIGKTTAIRLLSKQIKPNFNEEKEFSWEDIYRRSSMDVKNYLSSIAGEHNVSIKPQDIEKIREQKVHVRELLKAVGLGKEVLVKFGLEEIAERKVNELSGGELQKLSVAITVSKKADIYYIDELTNYLDIGERLRLSVMLKEFGEENSLIVVDHDLTVIDYLVDYAYIFFGEEGAYGAVSSLKAARTGINEYLQGFLRAENLKIRDFEIKFSKFSQSEERAPAYFKYPELERDFGPFRLAVEAGEIREKEVIGIVGGNALGKTTFMRMLAGVEKPDSGTIGEGRKTAYKKQYLEAGRDKVHDVLSKGDPYIVELSRRLLNIPANLLERRLDQLSGGQLQKVSIAHALSLEAGLYLLDEPSAFLDVEQRIAFCHLISDFVEYRKKPVFIIDHDISLIDRVSNRMMLFSGIRSREGHGSAVMDKREGMNEFLRNMDITIRRDVDTYRPRINKPGSVLDREQRQKGEYYVSS
jgi:ATP-binding cassette subfamily E protein 1